MKGILRKLLFGNMPVREYSTVTIAGDIKETVFLKTKKKYYGYLDKSLAALP